MRHPLVEVALLRLEVKRGPEGFWVERLLVTDQRGEVKRAHRAQWPQASMHRIAGIFAELLLRRSNGDTAGFDSLKDEWERHLAAQIRSLYYGRSRSHKHWTGVFGTTPADRTPLSRYLGVSKKEACVVSLKPDAEVEIYVDGQAATVQELARLSGDWLPRQPPSLSSERMMRRRGPWTRACPQQVLLALEIKQLPHSVFADTVLGGPDPLPFSYLQMVMDNGLRYVPALVRMLNALGGPYDPIWRNPHLRELAEALGVIKPPKERRVRRSERGRSY